MSGEDPEEKKTKEIDIREPYKQCAPPAHGHPGWGGGLYPSNGSAHFSRKSSRRGREGGGAPSSVHCLRAARRRGRRPRTDSIRPLCIAVRRGGRGVVVPPDV